MRITLPVILLSLIAGISACSKEITPSEASSQAAAGSAIEPVVTGQGPEFVCTTKYIGRPTGLTMDPAKGIEQMIDGRVVVKAGDAELAKRGLQEFYDANLNRFAGGGDTPMAVQRYMTDGKTVQECQPYEMSVAQFEPKEIPLSEYKKLGTQREGIALWFKLLEDKIDHERIGFLWSEKAAGISDNYARKDASLAAYENGAKQAIEQAPTSFYIDVLFSMPHINMQNKTFDLSGQTPVGKDKAIEIRNGVVASEENSTKAISVVFEGGKEFYSYTASSEDEARKLESKADRGRLAFRVYGQAVKPSDKTYMLSAVTTVIEAIDLDTKEVLFTLRRKA